MGKTDAVNSAFYEPFLRGTQMGVRSSDPRERLALLERMYVRNLTELCANRFKWEGLPETVDPRFLEMELTMGARALFLEHPKREGEYIVLRADGLGAWDYQDNPTSYLYTGNDILSGEVSADDAVMIWANYHRVPEIETIWLYAGKLAQLDRTIEINTMSARLTKVVAATENKRLSMANITKQIEEGVPIVYVTEGFEAEAVQVLDLGVNPESIVSMQTVKNKVWNEAMTLLGVNNANQDKKERLVSDEVGANDSQVYAFRNIALNARKQAAEKINERFGQNITVEYTRYPGNNEMEVDDSVGIYDPTENGPGAE